MTFIIVVFVLLIAVWLIARFVLQGESQARFDAPVAVLTGQRNAPSHEHHQIIENLQAGALSLSGQKGKQRLATLRQQMDAMGATLEIDGEIRSVDAGGVPAEWVLAPHSDPDLRLLYLHGGAFTMGSPVSHRAVTSEFARRLGASVLALDYRLMPENTRADGITDCQTAYRWIVDNGPDGPGAPDRLLVAGDSAGGNLTLMIIAWARDAGVRAADAAIALSPATDSTFGSPSMRNNVATDTMLGPMFGPMAKVPRAVMLWFGLLNNRMNPSDPRLSPLLGDLSGLPPVLVHASSAEMLYDDAVRYVNKARSQGTDAELGTWPFMLHVWHAFVRQLPEATDAFDHIEAFIRRKVSLNSPTPGQHADTPVG